MYTGVAMESLVNLGLGGTAIQEILRKSRRHAASQSWPLISKFDPSKARNSKCTLSL